MDVDGADLRKACFLMVIIWIHNEVNVLSVVGKTLYLQIIHYSKIVGGKKVYLPTNIHTLNIGQECCVKTALSLSHKTKTKCWMTCQWSFTEQDKN